MATHCETVMIGSVRGPTAVESVPVMNGKRAVVKKASFGELLWRGDVTSVERTCAETAKRSTARGQNTSQSGSARVRRRQD